MIKKTGAPVKISRIATQEEFDNLWGDIKKENEIIKCRNCDRIISKKFGELYTIKRKDLKAIVNKASIVCPFCKEINVLE